MVNILLIEDSSPDVKLATKALVETNIPHRLHIARDGEEGLSFLQRKAPFETAPYPDLVLLDLNLPKVNGKEILGSIKTDERLLQIPVIIFSTSNADRDVLEVYRLHANCYIRKPKDFSGWVEVFQTLVKFWLRIAELPGGNS